MTVRSIPHAVTFQAGYQRAGRVQRLAALGLAGLMLLACGRRAPPPNAATPMVGQVTLTAPALAPTDAPTTTPPAPTATPEPLAATVNGEAIPLAAYDHEVRRCQAGLGNAGLDTAGCPAAVLQSLIEQRVLEQAAVAAGLTVADVELDSALADIERQRGGPEALAGWLAANLYTAEEFREALRLDLLRGHLAEQAVAHIGPAAEQVHARAILVTTLDAAQAALTRLQAGTEFAVVALDFSRDQSSRAAGGDLGWFPRGLLTVPEVEAVAFALQPGEISDIIQSKLGYHIVQTLERDPARPLSAEAAQVLRTAAYETWLESLVTEAEVVAYVTP